jgi:hypothetical protein
VIFLVEGMIVGNGGHALPQSWSRLGPGMHQHKTNLSEPTFVGLPKAFGLDMSNAKSSSSSSSSNCCWLQYFLDTSINYHSSNASEVGALANKKVMTSSTQKAHKNVPVLLEKNTSNSTYKLLQGRPLAIFNPGLLLN